MVPTLPSEFAIPLEMGLMISKNNIIEPVKNQTSFD